jgi:hypothetical protein
VRMAVSMRALSTAGRSTGMVMRVRVRNQPQPETRPASSSAGSMLRMAPLINRNMKGTTARPWARIMPYHVKTSNGPDPSRSKIPRSITLMSPLDLPRRKIHDRPVISGGIMMGKVSKAKMG